MTGTPEAPTELHCVRTTRPVSLPFVLLDPAKSYVVSHGNRDGGARYHQAKREHLQAHPWLANGAMNGSITSAFDPMLYCKTGVTSDPVSAIRAWLIEAGASEFDRYALLHGATEVAVFMVGKPAPVRKEVPAGYEDVRLRVGRFTEKHSARAKRKAPSTRAHEELTK